MHRSAVIACLFTSAVAGCHPPDQAIYDQSRTCVGVFGVALRQIPSQDLRKAGLYRDDVEKAALGTYEDALKFGENTGLNRSAILKDVTEARSKAAASFGQSAAAAPAKARQKLLNAVKQCMPKPEDPNQ